MNYQKGGIKNEKGENFKIGIVKEGDREIY